MPLYAGNYAICAFLQNMWNMLRSHDCYKPVSLVDIAKRLCSVLPKFSVLFQHRFSGTCWETFGNFSSWDGSSVFCYAVFFKYSSLKLTYVEMPPKFAILLRRFLNTVLTHGMFNQLRMLRQICSWESTCIALESWSWRISVNLRPWYCFSIVLVAS